MEINWLKGVEPPCDGDYDVAIEAKKGALFVIKGECKKIKGFLGEDFAHGNVYSVICPEYESGKD